MVGPFSSLSSRRRHYFLLLPRLALSMSKQADAAMGHPSICASCYHLASWLPACLPAWMAVDAAGRAAGWLRNCTRRAVSGDILSYQLGSSTNETYTSIPSV